MDQSSSESEGNRLTQLVKHSWLLADSIRQSPAACSKTLLCQIQLGDEKIAWFRRSNSNAHHAVQLYVYVSLSSLASMLYIVSYLAPPPNWNTKL